MSEPRLRRYWIEFAGSEPTGRRQFGVTALDLQDALSLIGELGTSPTPPPEIARLVEDIDVSTLDAGHVLPNMASPHWRGVWFPLGHVASDASRSRGTEEAEYVLHDSPVWRARSDFIVNAPLPEAARPKRYEQLFVRRLGEDRFEVCCVPFFLYNVALGDIVKATDAPGARFLVSGVREPSGRFVFRAWFGSVPGHPHHEIAGHLARLGALMEWASANLLAIDAANEQHAHAIADYLAEQQMAGLLTYETGRS